MTPRIVVLGAGYAGLIAAKLAAKRTGATVTLSTSVTGSWSEFGTTSWPPASGSVTCRYTTS